MFNRCTWEVTNHIKIAAKNVRKR